MWLGLGGWTTISGQPSAVGRSARTIRSLGPGNRSRGKQLNCTAENRTRRPAPGRLSSDGNSHHGWSLDSGWTGPVSCRDLRKTASRGVDVCATLVCVETASPLPRLHWRETTLQRVVGARTPAHSSQGRPPCFAGVAEVAPMNRVLITARERSDRGVGMATMAQDRLSFMEARHRELDARLRELGRHAYLTPTEQREATEIKKLKLQAKDEIVSLRRALL